ncbi:uncharacterized protein HKW66_Vig0238080 [Vigna angularis]|uniref:PB1-like domain-containing protein n=1 Tax=Phaseolus angularis TaxID=3914 RepID=A0A8T0KT49_PHAAN|nr:uncharacterized protein HKW66_Vig0238080 [Vigna angularis]
MKGETSRFMFDPDVWSYFVVVSVVKSLGYHGFKDMWYSVGGASVLDDKLESLCDDIAAMHMVNLARLNGELVVIHLPSSLRFCFTLRLSHHSSETGAKEEKNNIWRPAQEKVGMPEDYGWEDE